MKAKQISAAVIAVTMALATPAIYAAALPGAVVVLDARWNTDANDAAGRWQNFGSLGGSYDHEGSLWPTRETDVNGVTYYTTRTSVGFGSFGRASVSPQAGSGYTGNEPSLSLTNFTVEVWLRSRGPTTSENQIFSLLNSNNTQRMFVSLQNGGTSTGLDIRMGGGATVFLPDVVTLPPGTGTSPFDQLVFTWDNSASQMQVYLNSGTPTTLNFPGVTWSAATQLLSTTFFKNTASEGDVRRFNGDISLVRIYDFGLNANQVESNFLSGPMLPLPEPSTVALLALGGLVVWRRCRQGE